VVLEAVGVAVGVIRVAGDEAVGGVLVGVVVLGASVLVVDG